MLEIDVSALAELLDDMLDCHRKLGTLPSFSKSLASMGDLVDHPRWKHRIVYEQTLCALGSSWDEDAARSVLAMLGPIDDVGDPEILELYVDVEGDRLGFAKRLALVDRIIAANRSPAIRLQYRSLRALQLSLIGDHDGGAEELRAAIAEHKERDPKPIDEYGVLQRARSCYLLAGLTNEKDLLGEAEELLNRLLGTDHYTSTGLAMLWRDLGDVLLDQGRVEDAVGAYVRSVEHADTPVGRIKAAKAMTVLEQHDRARGSLNPLRYAELSNAEKFDYNTVTARLAVALGDAEERRVIVARFEQLEVRDPYFKDVRNAVITELRTLEHQGSAQATGFFAGIWRMVNRYLLLQPNFFGLGINFNAMLEDAAARPAVGQQRTLSTPAGPPRTVGPASHEEPGRRPRVP